LKRKVKLWNGKVRREYVIEMSAHEGFWPIESNFKATILYFLKISKVI